MRTLFQNHFPDTEGEIAAAWRDAIIVFDANTLLNLYRYSDNSRKEFLKLLENLKERIWTPEQAASEYFKNRTTVIGDQAKGYDAAKKSINDLRESLRKDRGHPFVSEPTMTKLVEMLESVESELDANKDMQNTRITSDDIMNEIINLFDGRVGEKCTDAELQKIFEDGKARYEQKIPPGYKDEGKHKDPNTVSEKRSVFGDLIVWKQIIAKANASAKAIIFVTDDAKEDWWLETQGKTLGPRIELLEEFSREAGQKFYMYRPDQFLKHAKEQLHSNVSTETIDEIRATDASRAITEDLDDAVTDDRSRTRIMRLRNRLNAQRQEDLDAKRRASKSGMIEYWFDKNRGIPFDEESAEIDYRIIDIENQLEALSEQGATCRVELQEINRAVHHQNQSEHDSRITGELFTHREFLRARLAALQKDMSLLQAEFHSLISLRNRD